MTRARHRGGKSLLQLSPEIRLSIYEYLFYGSIAKVPISRERPILSQGLFRRYSNTDPQEVKEDFMAILYVNRQIRSETMPVMIKHLRMVVPVTRALGLVSGIPSQLRTLELVMSQWPVDITFVHLPCLQTLILNMQHDLHLSEINSFLWYASGNQGPDSPSFREYRKARSMWNWMLRLRNDETNTFRVLCRLLPENHLRNAMRHLGSQRALKYRKLGGRELLKAFPAKQSRFIDIRNGKDVDYEDDAAVWVDALS